MPSYLCVLFQHFPYNQVTRYLSTICLHALPAPRPACQLHFLPPSIVTALPVPCSFAAASQVGAEGSKVSAQVVHAFRVYTYSSTISRFSPPEPSLFHSSHGTCEHAFGIPLPTLATQNLHNVLAFLSRTRILLHATSHYSFATAAAHSTVCPRKLPILLIIWFVISVVSL